MGHASTKSTEIYLHPSIRTLRKAINEHVASRILDGLIKDHRIPARIQQMRDNLVVLHPDVNEEKSCFPVGTGQVRHDFKEKNHP
jgi:hypothetical protein